MAVDANSQVDPSEVKRKEALVCLEQSRDPSLSADGRLQKMQEAWSILEAALTLNPQNHRARFLLVSCCMNGDDFRRAKDEGLKIYNALSHEQRAGMGDAVLHISLAHASKMLGELDDAIIFAKEASEAYPSDPHPFMILGELYEANDQNYEAEQMCRQALRHQKEASCKHHLNPQSVYFTYCCLGACLIKQGKHSEAEQFLGQAIDLGSSSTLAHRHLVDVYHFQGRHDEALQVAHRLAEMDQNDEEIRQKIDVLMQTSESEGDGHPSPKGITKNSHVPSTAGSYDVVEVQQQDDVPRHHGSRHGSDRESLASSRRSKLQIKSDAEDLKDPPSAGSRRGSRKEQNSKGGDFMCCCFEKDKTNN